MVSRSSTLVHATAVAVAGRGVLILGPSGAGKSDLALRAITTAFVHDGTNVEVGLISDDQVLIELVGNRLLASPPPTIAGKLEVRGLGILAFPFVGRAEIALAISLKPVSEIERMPAPDARHPILGVEVPLISVDASLPGAPARLIMAALQSNSC